MRHPQRGQAPAQRGRVASCHHGRRDAGALQQLDAVAVERMEALDRLALVGEVETAVGQHAVDVEESGPAGRAAAAPVESAVPASGPGRVVLEFMWLGGRSVRSPWRASGRCC